jgi:citrate lyase subunit alpha/citrate CoA-transferase
MDKVYTNTMKLIEKLDMDHSQTISFHHHLREGDRVMETVIKALHDAGLRDLTVCSSSVMNCHDFLVEYIKNGTICNLETSGLRGELGKFISDGGMDNPVIIRSHGSRARAVSDGERTVNVAFIAASKADELGNATGIVGRNAFGSLGYGIWEARNAKKTVVVTDDLSSKVLDHISISQSETDAVLLVEQIGTSEKINSGALRIKSDPLTMRIAENTARFLIHSGIDLNEKAIQMGSGGISLQTMNNLTSYLDEKNIRFKFAVGGITRNLINLLEAGFVQALMDVQSFDPSCAISLRDNQNHHEVDVNTYANPLNPSNLVNSLDIAILSALEIDLNWNVNVITGSDGRFMGAVGGHQDVAEGSDLTIVVAPLIRGRIPVLTDRVNTLVTKGKEVDVFICEYGIAVKEDHESILASLKNHGIKTLKLSELYDKTVKYVDIPTKPEYKDKTVAIVQDRYGNTLSEIKQLMR